MATVFITGASGLMGQRLAAELLGRGHIVKGLVRPGSESRIVPGCEAVVGNAMDASTYRGALRGCDTLVHLVGVSHPSPAKAQQFRSVDLAGALAAVSAARDLGISHFVYVSVAHPAPVMREYIAARTEAEAAIRASGLNATILRPWYVLGPGRRWPLALLPMYWLMELLPSTRESTRRLGLVRWRQMIAALRDAVEHPAEGVKVGGVPEIRKALVSGRGRR